MVFNSRILDRQTKSSLTVLGSKVNKALNTLTWPYEEKERQCALDKRFLDNLHTTCYRTARGSEATLYLKTDIER